MSKSFRIYEACRRYESFLAKCVVWVGLQMHLCNAAGRGGGAGCAGCAFAHPIFGLLVRKI